MGKHKFPYRPDVLKTATKRISLPIPLEHPGTRAIRAVKEADRKANEKMARIAAPATIEKVVEALKGCRVIPKEYSFQRLDKVVTTTKIPCMCCKQVFKSEGKHNRLCSGCKKRGTDSQ